MRWCIVVLAAPFASFGEDSGNVRRGSADRPTHSALIGLAGAALGVERDDAGGQRRLANSFLTATRTVRAGLPLSDFHTFQSLPASRERVTTRAQALARRADLNTSVTRRDYRTNGVWQAAYAPGAAPEIELDVLAQAFQRPKFALWLGRKSCPLAHPLTPLVVEAEGPIPAFEAHAQLIRGTQELNGGSVAVDSRIEAHAPNAARAHRRLDEPGDRLRWHFSTRTERVFTMPKSAAIAEDGAEQ